MYVWWTSSVSAMTLTLKSVLRLRFVRMTQNNGVFCICVTVNLESCIVTQWQCHPRCCWEAHSATNRIGTSEVIYCYYRHTSRIIMLSSVASLANGNAMLQSMITWKRTDRSVNVLVPGQNCDTWATCRHMKVILPAVQIKTDCWEILWRRWTWKGIPYLRLIFPSRTE